VKKEVLSGIKRTWSLLETGAASGGVEGFHEKMLRNHIATSWARRALGKEKSGILRDWPCREFIINACHKEAASLRHDRGPKAFPGDCLPTSEKGEGYGGDGSQTHFLEILGLAAESYSTKKRKKRW